MIFCRDYVGEFFIVTEFLAIVRNMVEPICPRHQKFWLAEQSQMPLESDVLALEFLASYDYNVDKALFGLYCELGRGKGQSWRLLVWRKWHG